MQIHIFDEGLLYKFKQIHFSKSKHSSPKPAEKTKTPAPPAEQSSMSAGGEVAPSTVDMSDRKSRMVTQQSQPGSRPTSPDRMVPLYDKDLIRMLAEVAFIQGEVNAMGKLCITSVAS